MNEKPTECQCNQAGHCQLLRRQCDPAAGRLMTATRHRECQAKPGYFDMFLGEAGQPCPQRRAARPAVDPGPPPPPGPGAHLHRMLARLGITEKTGCGCGDRAAEMDRHGPAWCRDHLEEILDWMAEAAADRGLPFVRTAARVLVRRAIRLAERDQAAAQKQQPATTPAVPATEQPTEKPTPPPARPATRHPLARHVTSWAVGVTTAPRQDPTVARSVASIQAAGFSPTVYAEPGTDLAGVAAPIVQREERLGCWRNWQQTLRDLLNAHPTAQAVAIIQDDAVLTADVREFLERDLWPSPKAGTVSIYSCNFKGYEQAGRTGCLPVKGRYLMGAVANIFPRHVAEQIAKVQDWRGAAHRRRTLPDVEKKAVDTFIGHEVARLGLRSYYYTPSLVQHVADFSSIGHGNASGKRRSQRFPGEDASAFDVMRPPAWVRYNLPDGGQRFELPPPSAAVPVSVIIPAVDQEQLTARCLRSLADHRGQVPVRVVYVDNGSGPGVADRVATLAADLGLPLELIRNDHNRGFTKATNQGIRASSPDAHLLLLNNDAHLTDGALPKLVQHLEWHPRTAAVGPLSDDRGHQSIRHAHRKALQGRCHVTEETMLTGFCCLKHRDAIRDVGLLDEDPEFAGGLGTDDDWARRARRKGWRLLLCYDALCRHDHSATFQALELDRPGLQKRAMRKLRAKR